MATMRFRDEEIIGLGVAGFLHVGLLGVLLLQPPKDGAEFIGERVTVSLAEDISLESTAPELVEDSRLAMAPVLSDVPLPPEQSEIQPDRQPVIDEQRDVSEPDPKRSNRQDTKPKPTPTPMPRASNTSGSDKGGANDFSDAFKNGAGQSRDTDNTSESSTAISAQVSASLNASIARQLGRHWDAPEGVDAEKLYVRVSWRLNRNGGLANAPQCRPVRGITPSNRPQANIYCRAAKTAIRRAAPFRLPDRYYNGWKNVKDFQFDGEL